MPAALERQRTGAGLVSLEKEMQAVKSCGTIGQVISLSIERGGGMTGTLILVPGLNCTTRLFEPQIEALSRSRTVLVADTEKDDSLAAMARRLLADAPDRFAIAGLSMGGYVALEVLRQAPG